MNGSGVISGVAGAVGVKRGPSVGAVLAAGDGDRQAAHKLAGGELGLAVAKATGSGTARELATSQAVISPAATARMSTTAAARAQPTRGFESRRLRGGGELDEGISGGIGADPAGGGGAAAG